MANYNTTAKVTLSVNGRQAQQVLSTLQAEAQSLERKIAKAATAGDKATMKKLQRELTSTNRLISQLQGSANTAEQVLRRLDKATPKELQRTLRTLNAQLNSIERGSAAWNEHINKIRRVKEELAAVNRQLSVQQSRWEKLNNWLNNTQTALMGIAAAFAGLVMAGRKAVNTYAEMEEQLAGTRKYTGLSEESVLKLNEAFQNMDTRTSRQQLNELAQEAGRLGKNTLESVQGYVEAADIIHVALDDLGEGATQTIAKLTNIFGVDKMLGTKEAMLAVGSTVNELSQNCTASSSYLVEFAQRMAGIGASAGLTIPQILAFGAVLDANGQKVEMSATAIQKVINNLANKNQEFASRLGLDAQKLNETLKHSARDGIMMFLQALHDIGEKGGYENATMVLAPAFKDMGMDAARVSQVLATLANHIDEVKWQLGEADKAFEEASSATHEYEIFNNTAQASIDKAKKRVTELAVQLGEKLYPIMKHIYSSSGLFLRALNQIVSFIIEYKGAILSLMVGMVGYYTGAAIKKQQQASAAQGYSTGGFTPEGKVDEPVGIVHAGEWVASQKLVKSPRTRPLIEALDYAQRNNTIGSLKASDVSRSITAPMVLAQQSASPQIVVAQSQPTVVVEQNREYTDTMRRLADRLAEPFVTVATVTGDKGINKAQEEYDRLMRNKKPKSRK